MFATALGLAWVLVRQADADAVILAFGGLSVLCRTGLFQRALKTWA